MTLKANDVVHTITHNNENPKDSYKKVIEDIGNHLKENAERFANQIVDEHKGMKIEIEIPINDLVDFSVTYYEFIRKSEGK